MLTPASLRSRCSIPIVALLAVLASGAVRPSAAQERAALTFQDLMQVRQIQSPSISADGRWVALAAVPDRGDGEVLVYSTDGTERFSIPLASGPVISPDGRSVATRVEPSLEARETAEEGETPDVGMALLDLSSGDVTSFEAVDRFAFSGDGAWYARLHIRAEGEEEGDEPSQQAEPEESDAVRMREDPGSLLVLASVDSGQEIEVEDVKSFVFDESGRWVAYSKASPDGEADGVYLRDLLAASGPMALDTGSFRDVGELTWWEGGPRLAWVSATADDGGPEEASLSFWDGETTVGAVAGRDVPPGWVVPLDNRLRWTRDGRRLFFGLRPEDGSSGEAPVDSTEARPDPEQPESAFDPYDLDKILEGRGVDVWHTEDPLINPNQKQAWSREQERTFSAVFHLDMGTVVQLGDTLVQLEGIPENGIRGLAASSAPYLKERTWVGTVEDLYLVDLRSGERSLFTEGFRGGSSAANQWISVPAASRSLSPGGRYAAWFMDGHWHLYDAESGTARNLTEGMNVAFHDPDHDFPGPAGGHGLGGWTEGDRGLLVHDKYDVWLFPTGPGSPENLTGGEGRSRGLVLRVLKIDPERRWFDPEEPILLASFDEADKGFGFYSTSVARGGLNRLVDEDRRFRVLAKAEHSDQLLFTREDYDEFPDLWVGSTDLRERRKVTDVNPGLTDRFGWGTSELVEWTSDDGIPLQGVVIKPGNYEPGRRYPVLTYFYRFFSQRLHEFNQPVVNHRPSFPVYASDGYIVFLPDVRFEVGRPGISSMKSVVPGVKKLVDLGLADPEALGLHGHSWSGYTTSYIVTQTNIFAAAVAGAPVSNMTSAYGGIRWGTGLARQFQYEQGQSRLSGSLWEARSDYIENSPLFFADRIETPLVVMHGDEDEAVPWYQSIEFYLALRRLGKEAVFLQYRGEPHHPRKYANKLDYSLKMKAFFDHHLKGAPAPGWWSSGVPFKGK